MSEQLPTVTVNALYWYMALSGLAFLGLGWVIGLPFLLPKDFRLWIQRKQWAYVDFYRKMGNKERLIITNKNIDKTDQSFSKYGGQYFLRGTDSKGNRTSWPFKYGRSSYTYTEGNPMPHAITEHSFESLYSAQAMFGIKENAIFNRLSSMGPKKIQTGVTWLFLGMILILVVGLVFLVLSQNGMLNELLHPATVAGPSPAHTGIPG